MRSHAPDVDGVTVALSAQDLGRGVGDGAALGGQMARLVKRRAQAKVCGGKHIPYLSLRKVIISV